MWIDDFLKHSKLVAPYLLKFWRSDILQTISFVFLIENLMDDILIEYRKSFARFLSYQRIYRYIVQCVGLFL